MTERVHCEWLESEETAKQYPEEVRYHADHGDHLERCDAWVCICGNTPSSSGFFECDGEGNALEPGEGDFYYCDQCRRIIDRAGAVVGIRITGARELE